MQDAAEKQNLNLEETLKIVALELVSTRRPSKIQAEAKAPIAVPYSAGCQHCQNAALSGDGGTCALQSGGCNFGANKV